MRRVGFSSGAVAFGDFNKALNLLRPSHLECIELSALRLDEVIPIIEALPSLNLAGYSYVSFHAPSSFSSKEEEWLSSLLFEKLPLDWPIVLHPDTISNHALWARFGSRLAIENMDRRKSTGRSASELEGIFDLLPNASLCFDIGHAHQCDASMTEAYLILTRFGDRVVQVHISEVNSDSQHDPISHTAYLAFLQMAPLISENIPLIIESRVSESEIQAEVMNVRAALPSRLGSATLRTI